MSQTKHFRLFHEGNHPLLYFPEHPVCTLRTLEKFSDKVFEYFRKPLTIKRILNEAAVSFQLGPTALCQITRSVKVGESSSRREKKKEKRGKINWRQLPRQVVGTVGIKTTGHC